jgi:uncharacterized protein YukJ
MAIDYGVLRGRPDRSKREDDGRTPHLQIRVLEDSGQPWRVAVNVQSDTGSNVVFWVVDPLVGHPIVSAVDAAPSGFSAASPNAGGAIDYVKAPLFDWSLGRTLPPTGSASGDDLQDLLILYLDQCKAGQGELIAFGAKFDRNLHKPIDTEFGNTDGLHGIHDIHMNQGNEGSHAGDNGAFHDGGVLLRFPDRIVGLFLAFQTQRIPTDAAGAPAAGSRPLSEIGAGVAPGDVYLERALINPTGADPGGEVVVVGNLATATTTLAGWRLVDRNHRESLLDLTLQGGQSDLVVLDGQGAQLGNDGGNLILLDGSGKQVDSVTYAADEAAVENHYVRFRR